MLQICQLPENCLSELIRMKCAFIVRVCVWECVCMYVYVCVCKLPHVGSCQSSWLIDEVFEIRVCYVCERRALVLFLVMMLAPLYGRNLCHLLTHSLIALIDQLIQLVKQCFEFINCPLTMRIITFSLIFSSWTNLSCQSSISLRLLSDVCQTDILLSFVC